MQLSLLCSSTSQNGSYNMAFEVSRPLRMVKFCSSRAPWHDRQIQIDCNQIKQKNSPLQSFLSFESYKYKVPCRSCPFCTLLGKSSVWTVQSPMFKLKRSERIWKYLQMFTQHTTICKFAPEVENNSWNLCAKWVTWSSLLMLHGKSYRFCFIVCLHFLPKEKCEETTIISLAVADSLEVFWVLHASKQFLRFPFMPANACK